MGIFDKIFKKTNSQINKCTLCHQKIYGEETAIEKQKQAIYIHHSPTEATMIEQKSGYRCKSCGREYCKDCLEKKAPSNNAGGKSCPKCGGQFQIIQG